MLKKRYLSLAICILIFFVLGCNTLSLSLTTATPTPTETPILTNTPIPTATPKPLCPISDFDELDRFVEQFNTYIENGEMIIESGDILVQGMLLGGVKSWSESLSELSVSDCIQPAKRLLEESYEYMEIAVGTAQTGAVDKAHENFASAINSFEEYKAIEITLTNE